jgi:hypothetical protein
MSLSLSQIVNQLGTQSSPHRVQHGHHIDTSCVTAPLTGLK